MDQEDYVINFVRTSPYEQDNEENDSEEKPQIISICATYGKAQYVFMWDLLSGKEISSSKVDGNYTLLYDRKGNEYIV